MDSGMSWADQWDTHPDPPISEKDKKKNKDESKNGTSLSPSLSLSLSLSFQISPSLLRIKRINLWSRLRKVLISINIIAIPFKHNNISRENGNGRH
ncbi:hypothetical protein P8452_27093 [Trifolium repens]|nr:hypothetical protein P8452_27093 [Trifolium repens]